MNFCEVNILFAFIDIKQLRMRPTKKPGHGHITYNSGSYHVILPCSFYLSSQFSQPLTSNHLNALQIFFFFNFTILYWFCQISKWIHHRYTCVPHPEPSSLLPPHTIPLDRPSAPALSIQYRASNLDWRLIPYMIFYVFQCHSPKSSHSLPLPQSPKDCSIHRCLFCCLIYTVIVTIFLNSIYVR